jgi:hypothetical protein
MPSKPNVDEQVYEAIRTSKGVPFEIVTGGVRYKAVLQHKEARYVAVLVKFLRYMTDEVKGAAVTFFHKYHTRSSYHDSRSSSDKQEGLFMPALAS